MALNLGEKLRALWKLQPWYLWLAEGAAVGTIAYIAYTNRAASTGATTDPALGDQTTPPGEAQGPGTSPGTQPPPGYQPPVPAPDPGPGAPPAPAPPPIGAPPGYQPPVPSPVPSGIAPSSGPPQVRPPVGSGGKSSLMAHAFADVHMPSEWHENHQLLSGGSNLLPFHTAGEY